jgi:hypothetical protein
MTTFTKLQGQYLAFIDAYTKVNGRAPGAGGTAAHAVKALTISRDGCAQETSEDHSGFVRDDW